MDTEQPTLALVEEIIGRTGTYLFILFILKDLVVELHKLKLLSFPIEEINLEQELF